MQGNWTVCVPLKYLRLRPDIQEAKCFEFTVQMLPPPLGAFRGGANFLALRTNFALPTIISVYALAPPPLALKLPYFLQYQFFLFVVHCIINSRTIYY